MAFSSKLVPFSSILTFMFASFKDKISTFRSPNIFLISASLPSFEVANIIFFILISNHTKIKELTPHKPAIYHYIFLLQYLLVRRRFLSILNHYYWSYNRLQ